MHIDDYHSKILRLKQRGESHPNVVRWILYALHPCPFVQQLPLVSMDPSQLVRFSGFDFDKELSASSSFSDCDNPRPMVPPSPKGGIDNIRRGLACKFRGMKARVLHHM